jgi:glycosyltransferase
LHKDKNTILISEKDRGIFDAMNKGIKKSTGDIVGFLHSDDFYTKNYIIKKIVSTFSLEKKINTIYGDLIYVSKNDKKKKIRTWKSDYNGNNIVRTNGFYKKKLNQGWMPPHPTVFLKRDFISRIGNFNIKYKISSDYDYLIRCFSSKYLFAKYIPVEYVKMRIGGNSNKSLINLLKKYREDYLIARSNKLYGLYTVIMKNLSKLNQFFI